MNNRRLRKLKKAIELFYDKEVILPIVGSAIKNYNLNNHSYRKIMHEYYQAVKETKHSQTITGLINF